MLYKQHISPGFLINISYSDWFHIESEEQNISPLTGVQFPSASTNVHTIPHNCMAEGLTYQYNGKYCLTYICCKLFNGFEAITI